MTYMVNCLAQSDTISITIFLRPLRKIFALIALKSTFNQTSHQNVPSICLVLSSLAR